MILREKCAVNVTLFVRHQENCKEKKKRGLPHCDCVKWLQYNLNGKQYRVSTKTRSFAEAEEIRAATEKALRGGEQLPTTEVAQQDGHTTLQAALKKYIKTKDVSATQQNRYQSDLGDIFIKFAESTGHIFVENVDLNLIEEFQNETRKQGYEPSTRRKLMAKVRQFLLYCQAHGWLKVVPPFQKVILADPEAMPFSKEEYAHLLAQIGQVFKPLDPNGTRDKRKAVRVPDLAQFMHAMIQLQRYSGLAAGDALFLKRNELKWDDRKGAYRIEKRRKKTKSEVSVLLKPEIGE